MLDGPRQIQLTFEQASASGRVDHPASFNRRLAVGVGQVDQVILVVAQFHPADAMTVQKLCSCFRDAVAQMVFEATAVELVAGKRCLLDLAVFHPPCDITIVVVREEHPQPELAYLLGLEMVLEAQRVPKVMGLHLNAGLAHFVSGLSDGMGHLFDDGHREVGHGLPQLQCEGEAGDATTKDGHVNGFGLLRLRSIVRRDHVISFCGLNFM